MKGNPFEEENSEDSIDYDAYVIEDDAAVMNSISNQDEMKKVKKQMNGTVAKRVTGLFKGLFSKASKQVKSSIYRRNARKGGVGSRASRGSFESGKISLAEEPESNYRDSVYR